jgi:hypothetical protein
VNFHIGHEMVECLMRKPDSAATKRVARKRWSLDRLASALFLALRRFL